MVTLGATARYRDLPWKKRSNRVGWPRTIAIGWKVRLGEPIRSLLAPSLAALGYASHGGGRLELAWLCGIAASTAP